MTVAQVVRLAIGSVALLGVIALVLRLGRVSIGAAPYVAVGRRAAQLAVVALALRGVLSAPPTVVGALTVMGVTATRTATIRLRGLGPVGRQVVLCCVGGAGLALTVVFAVGVLPFATRYLIALGGIVIGGTMTAATLAGRHLQAGMIARREEIEAWLSIGATPRQAVADIARRAAAEALVPALDQTRTTGLVTLPGAFIGALLGGASPAQAARFQLTVLVALLAAQTIVAVGLVNLLGAPREIPVG